jgi:hypothetical protein
MPHRAGNRRDCRLVEDNLDPWHRFAERVRVESDVNQYHEPGRTHWRLRHST